MPSRVLLKSARLFHLYSGVFLAPSLIFFAITGGLQTFSFHETTKGSSYKPPQILVELGQLHKKQTLVVPVRKAPPQDAKPAPAPEPKAAFDPSIHGDHTNQQKHDRLAAPDQPPTAMAPAPAPVAAPAAPAPAPTPQKVHNLIPMKVFFVIVAFGLLFSTLTGLYMSYKYTRSRFTVTVVLLAGVVVPLLLLLF
ncbi:PepSY domain-containing protein [Granulicella sibirica]|uniref:Uncharacterized protein n=1 Tax=Granulicella sibirica TaxID=2479048 RepID=A0A4Q0SYE1_9BACT|nr:PepSY domain-containing protein [Granulicella sibirica]RXH56205.1 hypothetical protein GRAN_3062 [Granulicella sibirica]